MSSSTLNNLDDDDKWLINSLVKKDWKIPDIAKKLRKETLVVQAYLDSEKRSTASGTSTLKTLKSPASTSSAEPSQDKFQREAKFGKALLVPIEVLEKQERCVCQIQFNDGQEPASGFLLDLFGKTGIMTAHKVLPTEKICEQGNSKAVFDDGDGDQKTIKLNPSLWFHTSKELDASFVACDQDDVKKLEESEIEPWDPDFGDVSMDSSLSMFYTNATRNEKVAASMKPSSVKDDSFFYKENIVEEAVGAPVFSDKLLVGIHRGSISKDKTSTAVRIAQVMEWLKKEQQNNQKFQDNEYVQAQWSDGHFYPAKIIKKTETGYKVNYWQYEEEEDIPVSKIRKQPYISSTHISIQKQENIGIVDWLQNIGVKDSYGDAFKENGITDIKTLISMDGTALDKKLTQMNIKQGSKMKIVNGLSNIKKANLSTTTSTTTTSIIAPPTKSSTEQGPQLSTVNNQPMPLNWKPGQGDVDLTEQFTENGKCSIRRSCLKIRDTRAKDGDGYLPKNFYLYSTSQKYYFKIELTYSGWDERK